jgi:hypothetical protein
VRDRPDRAAPAQRTRQGAGVRPAVRGPRSGRLLPGRGPQVRLGGPGPAPRTAPGGPLAARHRHGGGLLPGGSRPLHRDRDRAPGRHLHHPDIRRRHRPVPRSPSSPRTPSRCGPNTSGCASATATSDRR